MTSSAVLLVAFATTFCAVASPYKCHCNAFALIVAPQRDSRFRQIRRFGRPPYPRLSPTIIRATPDDDDTEEGSSDFRPEDGAMSEADLDQQKVALENALNSNALGSNEPPNANFSALTTSRRQRFEREIELLEQLDPDHPANKPELSELQNQELVISELWSLWYGERGPANGRKLQAAEASLADPSLWPEAEKQYVALINEHCGEGGGDVNLSHWVEPANRLATLLFLMGRFAESKQWCERILREKPWHVGALQGVVLVCAKMGDREGVVKYSSLGLPNTTARGERREWVRRNVGLAKENLSRLEALSREAYGRPDRRPLEDDGRIEEKAEDGESSWQ